MVRYIYGHDLAETVDFYALLIHRLEPDSNIPILQTIRKIRKVKYPQIREILRKELYPRFPPYLHVTDYTSERSFSQELEAEGQKVLPIHFNTSSKLLLKQDGLKILQEGYTFPDPYKTSNPMLKEWILELMDQLKHEQILYVGNNTEHISFDHPEGDHNDLATAWELSIHGCIKLRSLNYSYRITPIG